MGNALKPLGNSDDYPESFKPPSYDPNIGFPKGRKERVSRATEQELMAANVPKRYRDYCGHKYLELLACQRQNFPLFPRCKAKHHEYVACEGEDYTLRMKEYERERRLRRREKKKEEAMKVAAAS